MTDDTQDALADALADEFAELRATVDRLASYEAIRQLVYRYAVAVDARVRISRPVLQRREKSW